MARLPVPGSDENTWGAVLNEFLRVSHREDGKPKAVMDVFNVKDYGALGDGKADDTQAVQQAINAIDEPGRKAGILYFPHGAYRLSTITIPVSIRGLTIAGSGRHDSRDGTRLVHAGTGPLFTTGGEGSFVYFFARDIAFVQADDSAGHVFELLHSPSGFELERIHFALRNPHASFLKAVTGNPSLLLLRNMRGFMAPEATVPAVDVASEVGCNLYAIEVSDTVINSHPAASAPILRFENGCGGCESWGPVFRNVVLEQPAGGGIHLYSFARTIFENVVAADLPPNQISQPIIRIGRSAVDGSLRAKDIVIVGGFIVGGTPEFPDVEVVSDIGQGGLVIIGSRIGQLKSTRIPPIIVGSTMIHNLVDSTRPFWINAAGRMLGVRSISQTTTQAFNLRGSFTISGTNTSATVTFEGRAESDNEYFLSVTPTATAGSPAVGSNRVLSVSKEPEGFTAYMEAAPGENSSVSFDWHLIR